MKAIIDFEKWLSGVYRSAPRLSKKNKELVVQAWPWVALLFGGLQVLSLISTWGVIQEAQRRGAFLSYLGAYNYNIFNDIMMYGSFTLSIVTAVMLLVAYGPLKARALRGWQLLFLVAIIGTIAGFFALFIPAQGVGVLLVNLLIATFVFYFLLEVRGEYKGHGLKVFMNHDHKKDHSDS